jgi:hypothetical protein
MPGVAESGRVVVADNQLSLIILLPDNSQILITADRVAYLRDGYMQTLAQWQAVPVPAEYEVSDDPPELPDAHAGVFTLGGRRTWGGSGA